MTNDQAWALGKRIGNRLWPVVEFLCIAWLVAG